MATKVKEKGKKRQKLNISNEQFITTWQTSNSLEDVATKLNITKTQAASKAVAMRQHQIKLKKMHRGRVKEDWNKLVELAASFAS